MQRTLSAAARANGHPIRRSLAPAQPPKVAKRDEDDLKLFALSFTAFFICIYTMIF